MKNSCGQRFVVGICLAFVQSNCIFAHSARAADWTQFRGDDGAGKSSLKGLPVTWSPGDYTWSVDLPGVGHSSPVIIGDRLFVTSAIDEGAVRYLFCLNAKTGAVRWQQPVGHGRSAKHAKSSWASSTPATDGEHVFIAFADKEQYSLTAWTLEGKLKWRSLLGPFDSQHGLGVSPIVYKNLVIAANDQDGPSSIVALNRQTGAVVWSTLRDIRRASYATPMIIDANTEQPQLLTVSGAMGVTSLDPATGEQLWTSGEVPLRTVASPVVSNGLAFVSCGQGGRGTYMAAVDTRLPAALGDAPRVRWERKRNLPYVPTPIAHDGLLFLWNDNGVLICTDAATGKDLWTERVGGNYSGSPVLVDGKLYCMSEEGKVVVVAAAKEYKLLGETELGDSSHATPAVANGHIYFRTFTRLLALPAATEQ